MGAKLALFGQSFAGNIAIWLEGEHRLFMGTHQPGVLSRTRFHGDFFSWVLSSNRDCSVRPPGQRIGPRTQRVMVTEGLMQPALVEPVDVLRTASSSWERERHTRSVISSVLNESTKLSAIALS